MDNNNNNNKDFKKEDASISYIIICKNEEKVIFETIESIKKNIQEEDEIIVVDTGSTDNTVDIINRRFPETLLYHFEWNNNFSAVRNFAKNQSKKSWVYFIDADEKILEDSYKPLKNVLNKLIGYEKYFTIRPIILNHDSHIIVGVDRIFKTNFKFNYYGYVHEELRVDSDDFYPNIDYAVVNDNILKHDGYTKRVVQEKNKMKRNVDLLKKNLFYEPQHLKWNYYIARDGREILSIEEQLKYLEKALSICEVTVSIQSPFYYRIVSDMIGILLNSGNIIDAKEKLSILKSVEQMESDYLYYKETINLIEYKNQMTKSLHSLIQYRERSDLALGNLHSNNFHIDFLISLYLFELGDFKKSYNISKKLAEENFENLEEHFKKLRTLIFEINT